MGLATSSRQQSALISFDHVNFSYDQQPTLCDFNLQVYPGEVLGLVGESGCGKTTVLRMLNGLIPHFYPGEVQGKVTLAGQNPAQLELWEIAKQQASVFQNPRTQFFATDTRSELAFACENQGLDPQVINQRIAAATRKCQTAHLLDRDIFALSAGQKQLLAATGTLVANPKIFLFDEPTANLSAEAIAHLRDILQDLKAAGATILLAEHRLYWLAGLLDRVIYLSQGRLIKQFSGQEFFQLSKDQQSGLGLRSLTAPIPVRPDVVLPAASRASFASPPPSVKPERFSEFSPPAAGYLNAANGSFPETNSAPGGITCEDGLWVENLRFSYQRGGEPILDIPQAFFPAGKIIALTGKNGVGKTTLANLLCGLLKPQRGKIKLVHPAKTGHYSRNTPRFWHRSQAGSPGLSPAKLRKIAFQVLQDTPRQLVAATVRAELQVGADKHLNPSRVEEVLASFGLEAYADRHPLTLSGGQQQRLCLALAQMIGKQIYLFDEPTSGLDASHLSAVVDSLHSLEMHRKVVLVVTHDPELIAATHALVYQISATNLVG